MLLLFFPLFLSTMGAARPGLHVKAPRTSSSVMIDGRLSAGEWRQASRISVPGVAELYFQQAGDFVYIAVRYTDAPSGMVDLYLSSKEGEIYDLHASAKLGERQLHGTAFPDWEWWNNRDWIANVSRADSFEKRTFLPTPVREFQIRRSRFSSTPWHLRFDLTAMARTNETLSTAIFPAGTADRSTQGWLQLDLE
jgi:hypothetical protein